MTEFQYLNGGNSEAQDKLATSFLFAQSATPGIAATGVLQGLGVTQTPTASTAVLVGVGAGIVQASLLEGAELLVNDTQENLDILTANPVGSIPRNDIIVFDSATLNASTGAGGIRAILGTPNATPTDPTVPTSAIPLFRVRQIASGQGGFGTMPTTILDDLRVYTNLRGITPKDVLYTTIGGGIAPAGAIGNTAGTILQTLTIPAATFARSLDVTMTAYLAEIVTSDSWEVVGTQDSTNITSNVTGRFRVPSSGSGSGVVHCQLSQAANTATVLRVWVRRVSGTGGANPSTDETFTHIDVIAKPA